MLKTIQRSRLVLDLPLPIAKIQARALEIVNTLTLGMLPDELKLTRDQVILLQTDNVVSDAAKAEGRSIEAFGIVPTAAEAVVPGYLWTFRKAGQFAEGRGTEAQAGVPDMIAPEPMAAPSTHRPERAAGPAIGADAGSSPMGSRWGRGASAPRPSPSAPRTRRGRGPGAPPGSRRWTRRDRAASGGRAGAARRGGRSGR